MGWGEVIAMIDCRILGPLEVNAGGRVIDIGGPKQRALLAILPLRANEPVPRDVPVHELWGSGRRPARGAALRCPCLGCARLWRGG